MADIVCIGFSCVDLLIHGMEVAHGRASLEFNDYNEYWTDMEISHGGDAMNEAVVLGKLGCDVRLVTAVGDDDTGGYLISMAAQHGVDTKYIQRCRERKTEISGNVIQKDGERYYLRIFSATPDFSWDQEVYAGARIVSLGSLFIRPFDDIRTVRRTLSEIRSCGAVSCADLKAMPSERMTKEDVLSVLPDIDYIFPNYEEGVFLTGLQDPEKIVRYLLKQGVGHVVLKVGGDGCLIGSKDEVSRVSAFPAEMVDSTGAGDSFMAGFMCALLDGYDMKGCASFACAAASLNVRMTGASTGITGKEAVLAVMQGGS